MKLDVQGQPVPADALIESGFEPAASAGLFMGVSRFSDPGFAAVPYAVDDAVDLAHLFTCELGLVQPRRIVLALAGEPVKEGSIRRLRSLLEQDARRCGAEQTDAYTFLAEQAVATGEKGLFILSMATHGFTDQGGDYVVASDSLRRRIQRTGISVDELFDDVSRASARRRLVLLDACRERLTSGTRTTGEASSAMSQSFAESIAKAEGLAVLTGTTLGGYSYDDHELNNGVFTAAVIDGLQGAAPGNNRGIITLRTLADYVDRRIAAWVSKQFPDHASLSRGIARRIEGAADLIPLAVNPEAAAQALREREDRALEKLRSNIGSIITGSAYDRIVGSLKADRFRPQAEELLHEIEALDGSVRSRRAFMFFFEHHQRAEPAEQPARLDTPGTVGRTGRNRGHHSIRVERPSASEDRAVASDSAEGLVAGEEGSVTILLVNANRGTVGRRQLGAEARDLQETMRLAKRREMFRVETCVASRPEDLTQAILDYRPRIIHFSGHGLEEGALYFENAAEGAKLVEPESLGAVFRIIGAEVDCVLLDSSFSEREATEIAEHVERVIRMSCGIRDDAGRIFTVGFYKALGVGRSIEEAFEFGKAEVSLEARDHRGAPVLLMSSQGSHDS